MQLQNTIQKDLVNHLPNIRLIVSKMVRDEHMVDDITQECLVRIIEKEHLWDKDKGDSRSWINTIVRNVTRRALVNKSRINSKEEYFEEDAIAVMDEDRSPNEQILFIISQFHTLSDKKKQILQMRYYENRTLDDIANILNISRPTVMEHLDHSIKKLQKNARRQGLLSVLLPWNWSVKSLHSFITKNTATELITLAAALLIVSTAGYQLFTYTSQSRLANSSPNNAPVTAPFNNDSLAHATISDKAIDLSKKESAIEKLIRQLNDNDAAKSLAAEKTLTALGSDINSDFIKVFSTQAPATQKKMLDILQSHSLDKKIGAHATVALNTIKDLSPQHAKQIDQFFNTLNNVVDAIEGIEED